MTYVYLFFALAISYIIMAVQILSRDRHEKLNKMFYGITMLFCFWSILNGILFLVTEVEIAVQVRRFGVFAWGTIYSLILSFVMILTGYDKKMKSWVRYSILYIPVAINWYLYFILYVKESELVLSERGWILSDYFNRDFIWDNFFYVYYVSFMVASVLILKSWLKKETIKRKVLQGKVIMTTFIVAFIVGTIFEVILPINGFTIISGVTIIIALIPIGGIWYAMDKFGLMSFKPEKLALEVLEVMDEALIICDNQGDIQSINEGGKSMLSCTDSCLENIYQLFDTISLNEAKTSFDEVIKRKDGQTLDVLVTTQPLLDMLGEHYGTLIVFQDISALKEVEKELLVTNENLEKLVANRTKELIVTNDNLINEMEARKNANEKVKHMAFHDYLTSLPNMRLFKRTLKRMMLHHEKCAVLFIDLTAFKSVNDVLGHAKGDVLIKGIAHRLNTQLKVEEFIARSGGDEFLYLVPYLDIKTLKNRINDLLELFKKPFILNTQDIHVSIGIGVSLFPEQSEDIDELLKLSDIAMIEAKNRGRNAYAFFDEKMKETLDHEIRLTYDLYDMISEVPFVLYYQPQIDVETGNVIGAEALLRWQHPQLGIVPPNQFIPLIEKNGMMLEVGKWIIEEAFSQQKKWSESNGIDLVISVNLSGHQLTSKHFNNYIESLASDSDYDFSKIEFEVTESIFLHQWEVALNTLEKLHSLGASIAIDDFGVDYSSLRYIKSMPLSTLKIDKSFIDGIGRNKKDEAIIQTIITLAKTLDMHLVAEGVEEEMQVEFLKAHSCDAIQGYYYSRPLTVDDFETYITSK